MATHVRVHYLDGTEVAAVIGTGEQIRAPRDLAAMERAGWVIDDTIRLTYQAWLALRRQGDETGPSGPPAFEAWCDRVAEVDAIPTRKQIEEAVAMGAMKRKAADRILALYEGGPLGEAGPRRDV